MIRAQQAAQHADCGRFAGTVRADQAQGLAGFNLETDVVDREASGIGLAQFDCLKEWRGHDGSGEDEASVYKK